MKELIRLFTQIALLRRGPQDLPASSPLLALAMAAYFLANAIMEAVLPTLPGPVDPPYAWLWQLLVIMTFTFLWYRALLRLAGKPERFLQTATAVFGFTAVLSPVLDLSGWLLRRFYQDSVWQLPVTLVGLVLLIWMITVNSHIVKAALEWSGGVSVALVVLQTLAGNILVLVLFPSTSA